MIILVKVCIIYTFMDKICKEKCKGQFHSLSYVVAESCQMCPVLDNAKFSSDFKDKKLRKLFL